MSLRPPPPAGGGGVDGGTEHVPTAGRDQGTARRHTQHSPGQLTFTSKFYRACRTMHHSAISANSSPSCNVFMFL